MDHADKINVTHALNITKKAAYNAIGASHQAQFRSSNSGAAIIMWVQADDHAIATIDVFVHELNLISIQIGRGGLDGGRQVKHHALLGGGLPFGNNGIGNGKGDLGFSGTENLRSEA